MLAYAITGHARGQKPERVDKRKRSVSIQKMRELYQEKDKHKSYTT